MFKMSEDTDRVTSRHGDVLVLVDVTTMTITPASATVSALSVWLKEHATEDENGWALDDNNFFGCISGDSFADLLDTCISEAELKDIEIVRK
jgi:hypothetical protein